MARDWETPSSLMLAANVKSAASRIVTTTVAVSITEQRKSPNAIGSPNDPMRQALNEVDASHVQIGGHRGLRPPVATRRV